MLAEIRTGLDHIYNYQFDAAGQTLQLLEREYPGHPVTPLFEGLIHYWKHYPLTPGGEGSVEFEQAMKESWERALQMNKTNEEYIESVFFDLMARSFIVMYYADNGVPAKAITHLGTIYRGVKDGFDLLEEFKEFYFITGLYNYYREAFIEAYPVYKPISIFFRKGDKDKGMEMLRYAISECNFMHVEAALFMTLIQVNFESLPDSAVHYARVLHETYPGNAFFHSKYAEMLLVNRQYEAAITHIRSLNDGDRYNRMKGTIYLGIYHEKHDKDHETARSLYEKGLRLAEEYGDRANYSRAYAYMGLSRYHAIKGELKESRDYRRKAGASTGYEYVLA